MTATCGNGTRIVGHAVLRDYPVKIWHRGQEHTAELLREFQLLIAGQVRSDSTEVPEALLSMADMVVNRYSELLTAVNEQRQQAFDAGLDRIDSVVPMPAETPQLIPPIMDILRAADEYCRSGDLLTLATPPDVAALREWSTSEILRQFHGERPIPWPGSFT